MYEQSASPNDKIKKALLLVVRRHLTAPPSSTNVERLFSYGGLVATDHRASLAIYNQNRFLTSPEGFFTSGGVWFDSGDVALTREMSGVCDGFYVSRGQKPN